ncbi:MAG: HAMP domain-containing sensor histidine kinase [Paracoccaceae bacterium]
MRHGNILSGAAFQTAALSLAAFVVVLGVAGAAIISTVRASMTQDLRAQIAEEVILFQEIFHNQGPEELLRVMESLARANIPEQQVVGLFSKGGDRLAGDLPLAPDFVGWGTLNRGQALRTGPQAYQAEVVLLEGRTIVVGRSLAPVRATTATLIRALALAGLAVTVVSLLIGYLLSRNVFGKLDRMALTLDAVSRGDSRIRLPVGASNDQIDRVSVRINRHLDRLSDLTESTKNTIIAIAHDLRTPLTRAYNLVQSAGGEAGDPPERARALAGAEAELEAIGGAFDAILRISRISAANGDEGFAIIGAAALTAEIAETYEPVLEAAGQTLVLRTPPEGDAMILGDQKMLWQMLVNLVENASRHCPAGTRVTISASSAAGPAVIEVSDDGPGVPVAMMDKIVAPFTRIEERAESGAGFGLALVRAIAERHRATLEVADNAPGLRVTVRFPPAPAPAAAP